MKTTLTTLLIFTLSACTGWHLRGSDQAIDAINQSVFLSGERSEVYSLVEKELSKQKQLASLTNAQLQLVLGKENIQRRSASLTSSAAIAEYQLSLRLPYSITVIGSDKTSAREASVIRSYTFDENDIVGKQREEALLQKEMRRIATRQILQQLRLLQP